MTSTSINIPNVTGMSLLQAALAFGKGGLFIAPTAPGDSKNPGSYLKGSWETKTVRSSADIFALFGEEFIDAVGIALHCGRSGLIVIDVDTEDESLIDPLVLRAIREENPPYQITRKGSVLKAHYFFKQPRGRDIGNSYGKLALKKWGDIRGRNGVVIMEPSYHTAEDGEYRLKRTGEVPELPSYLADVLPDQSDSSSSVSDAQSIALRLKHTSALKPEFAGYVLAEFLKDMQNGGRHAAAVNRATQVARESIAGLYPAGPTMRAIEDAFIEEICANPGDSKTRQRHGVQAEWCGIEAWAWGQALAETPERLAGIRERVLPSTPASSVSSSQLFPEKVAETVVAETNTPEDGETVHNDSEPETEKTPEETIEAMEYMSPSDRLKECRALVPVIVQNGADESELMDWRDRLKAFGMTKGDFDKLVKLEKDRERKARQVKKAADEPLGIVLPAPTEPMAVARKLVALLPNTDGISHKAFWRGDFYEWTGDRWTICGESVIHNWLYAKTEHATFTALDKEGEPEQKKWSPTKKKVEDVTHALGAGVLHRPTNSEPDKVIALTNGALKVAGRALAPHTPAVFNLNALPFAYDSTAEAPLWHTFLEEVQPGDQQAKDFLQEWFGYVLSGRMDLQKMAMFVGRSRGGKGTIASVLKAMVGAANIAAPRSLVSLTDNFGLSSLIGKTLAIMGDVDWNGAGGAVELLKNISGGDSPNVPRKNRPDWDGDLNTRFLLMSNDPPSLKDASGALVNRMIIVRFSQSFLGRENPDLLGKLLTELPGILNWALDGLDRLNTRGRFTQPESGAEDIQDARRRSSHAFGFVDEWCELSPNAETPMAELYTIFRKWAVQAGIHKIPQSATFASDLYNAFPDELTKVRRRGDDGKQTNMVTGLRVHDVFAKLPI